MLMTGEDWRKSIEDARFQSYSSQDKLANLAVEDRKKQQKASVQTQSENTWTEVAIEKQEEGLTGVSIGSKLLLRLLYVKKAEGVITMPASTAYIFIETLGQSQFAFYDWDVVCLNDDLLDVFITTGIVGGAVGGGIQCGLLKRRNFRSPDKIDVMLLIDSVIGGDVTLAYRVYRKAGLD